MPLSATTLARLGVPVAKAQQHLPYLVAAMRRYGITSQRRAECFLAQLLHESAMLHYFEELCVGCRVRRSPRSRQRASRSGVRQGRGPIQLTGRANYRRAGAALKVDFEGHPQLVATPRYGYLVAAGPGASTGSTPSPTAATSRGSLGASTARRPGTLRRTTGVASSFASASPATTSGRANPPASPTWRSLSLTGGPPVRPSSRRPNGPTRSTATRSRRCCSTDRPSSSPWGPPPARPGNGRPNGTLTKLGSQLQTHDARGDALRALLTDRVRTLESRRRTTCTAAAAGGTDLPADEPAHEKRACRRLPAPPQSPPRAVQGPLPGRGRRGVRPETRAAARKVAFGMGLSLKELEHGRHAVRAHADPAPGATQRARACARHGAPAWLRRLRRRYDGHGPASAIAYARKHLGVKEAPGCPNRDGSSTAGTARPACRSTRTRTGAAILCQRVPDRGGPAAGPRARVLPVDRGPRTAGPRRLELARHPAAR